jgi:hypothetical protein
LSIALPAGKRIPPAEPRPIPYLQVPSAYAGGGAGFVVVAFLGERATALRMTLSVAERRARQRLRHALGFTYEVSWAYEPLTREVAHVAIWADCLPENAREVARELLAVLDELAAPGPTDDELERAYEDEQEWLADSDSAASNLFYRAHQELLDDEFQTDEELLAEMRAVTPQGAAHALAAGLETALVIVPDGTRPPNGRFSPYPNFSPERLSGRRVSLRGLNIGRDARRTQLVHGDDGISLLLPEEHAITVRFDDCVALERWTDGTRALWGEDGFRLEIPPEAWRGGEDIVRAIDERVPPDLVVPMDRDLEQRTAAIDELADEKVKRGWATSDELKALPTLLGAGEQLVTLAQASRGWRSGVLALTDRRLLFLFVEDLVDELELTSVTSAEAQSARFLGGEKLVVEADGSEYTYVDIKPDRLSELLAELRQRLTAS